VDDAKNRLVGSSEGASCVERLRDARNRLRNIGWSDEAATADEAADEIERLRGLLRRVLAGWNGSNILDADLYREIEEAIGR
jgi:hypothetical protein